MTQPAAGEPGINDELGKITDINEITAFGVIMMPAPAVDGQAKVASKLPALDELKEMLQSS